MTAGLPGPRKPRWKDRARALGGAAVAALIAVSACAGAKSAADPASNPGSAARATAASGVGGPAWSALKPAQQAALAPLQHDWSAMDAERKAKWLELAARLPSMPADERLRIQARMAEWARMTPSERGRARLQFQQARELGSESRQAQWDAYQALPADQRRALAEQSKPAASGARSARADSRPASPGAAASAVSAASVSNEKRNIVGSGSARAATGTPVTPTSVQVSPGATTTLMSKPAEPPAHHQPGLPKIAASNGFVDPATLLPRRGPQGAAVQAGTPAASTAAAAASAAVDRP